jgi:hypothetical protein
MRHERYAWSVCHECDGVWESICTHETHAEAEADLRETRAQVPNAFLVRITMTRVGRACSTPPLRVA